MMNCKQASEMASQQLDRELGLRQRVGLKLHLLMCRYCRTYARQLAFLHRAAPKLESIIEECNDITLPPERKKRMRQSLEEHN